jgi:hypothetical protein
MGEGRDETDGIGISDFEGKRPSDLKISKALS